MTAPTVFIGIDPGTKTGWAVLDATGSSRGSGTWKLERRAGDGAGMIFVRFERLFRELLDAFPNSTVTYEQQLNRFAGSAIIGAGIMASIQRVCEEVQRPYSGITFSTVKKHATGRGNCGKSEMVRAALDRWGPGAGGIGEDQADALWIADAAREGLA